MLLFLILFISVSIYPQDYDRKLFGYDSRKARKMLVNTNESPYIHDIYSGDIYDNAGQMDVDHIVPLRLSWSLGAKDWSEEKRKAFANDPDNLILVSASCNRRKGHKSLSEWLPKNKDYHSEYSNRYLFVIEKYGLEE